MSTQAAGARARALSKSRHGYALLAVLWMCAGAATLALGVSAAAHEAIASSRNRIALAQAEWLARGCIARVRATISLQLQQERRTFADSTPALWLRLDSVVHSLHSAHSGACAVGIRAAGARFDVNAADEQLLARLFRHAGVAPYVADSIAAALADWMDADDAARPLGAEREWYVATGMIPPGNRPFQDAAEIALARGMSAIAWQELLDVERSAIAISHAAAPILAVLPGFTDEAVGRVIDLRRRNRPPRAFLEIADGLTTEGRNAVMAALPELAALVSLEPRAWLLHVEARSGKPAVRVSIEARLERAGSRVHIARARTRVQ